MPSTRNDKDAARGTAELGPLPVWDLADLYPAPDSPDLKRDLEATERAAEAFRQRHQGKLATLSGAALGQAVAEYERLQETLGRIMSYASLLYSGDMADVEIARFFQNMQEKVNALSSVLLFFALELNRIEDAALDEKLGAP
jgi:oligoendopeptidase F